MLGTDAESVRIKQLVKKAKGIDQAVNIMMDKMNFMKAIEDSHHKMLLGKRREMAENKQTSLLGRLQTKASVESMLEQGKSMRDKAVEAYLAESTKQKFVPPNLYKLMNENKLEMVNHHLAKGICHALAKAISLAVPDPLEVLTFKNNELSDENFSIILAAVLKRPYLRGLQSLRNFIGPQSAPLLVELCQRN